MFWHEESRHGSHHSFDVLVADLLDEDNVILIKECNTRDEAEALVRALNRSLADSKRLSALDALF